MYCSSCGTPITQGLSFCNRCGANLKDRPVNQNMGPISAFLTAIVILGVVGLGIMLGGSLVLRKEAGFPFELIAIFMLLIVGTIEFMLIRQLSRLTGAVDDRRSFQPPQPVHELRPASVSNLPEPGSVIEGTTRTLEYTRREQ